MRVTTRRLESPAIMSSLLMRRTSSDHVLRTPAITSFMLFIISLLTTGFLNPVWPVYYNVGVLMTTKLNSPFDLERCGPAVDLALQKVNDEILKSHNIELRKIQASYPSCSGAHAPGLATQMYYDDNVLAFIGPACAFALEPVARLAAFWNRPIITGMGDQPPSEGQVSVMSGILGRLQKWKSDEDSSIFKDKSEYPTLTRMSYCPCRLIQVFESIFHQFNWLHVALILDKSDLFSLIVGKNLQSGLYKAGLLHFFQELDGNDEMSCEKFLHDASKAARVIILSVRGWLLRKFMLAAFDLGMTKGDWVFLDVEIVQGAYWGDHTWKANDENDSKARTAYEALLRVSLLEPTNRRFHEFSEKVKKKAESEYNYTFARDEEVNFFVGAFYDGVYLLGMVLNETLNAGGNIFDGKSITESMWNRTFEGITGQVRIDENGERDADYGILDLDPITGEFEVIAHYYGKTQKYSTVVGKRIHWPGGKEGPPPDIPECGFMGNSPTCIRSGHYVLIFYIVGGICMLVTSGLAGVYFVKKQMRMAADLNNMKWRMRPEEILLEVNRPYTSRLALQKPCEIFEPATQDHFMCRRPSENSNSSLPLAQVYTTVGNYKGSRVAIKKIVKNKVEVNKKLLLEIKQVRDVSHENTVRFIGACIECPVILILTEYCPKGSLKDVLENEELKLDWNFRMSLIHDIVKGMTYLHSCEIVHGKLSSRNCLIDGRFVLKISDFGLRTLRTPSEEIKDHDYYHKLLWVSPERLQESSAHSFIGSQKADVYSFAIILEEIVVRGGPYEKAKVTLTTTEILDKVCSRDSPPFRPDISGYDCPPDLADLMNSCWEDNPDDRPTFETVRGIVRRTMKGYCENLMDDLLKRMEQYANNLEALVEEKTDQLSQEKRRSEELLFQVLPRPVAQQLMAGEMVKPEQFESVTVYFSDIVGFTSLCVQSSPMQVVNLLNDLYSTFDRVIGFYEVYKVETIGDAYMVVSGLPERNVDNHAREICSMALAILDAVQSFTIKHRPDAQLQVRIGIHSGPVCAGVVGQKMPHYCLFGDTVNTASRMESTGEPLRIHITQATKDILDTFNTFQLELRGEVELKGKGSMVTYWLLGCTENDRRSPAISKPDGRHFDFKMRQRR